MRENKKSNFPFLGPQVLQKIKNFPSHLTRKILDLLASKNCKQKSFAHFTQNTSKCCNESEIVRVHRPPSHVKKKATTNFVEHSWDGPFNPSVSLRTADAPLLARLVQPCFDHQHKLPIEERHAHFHLQRVSYWFSILTLRIMSACSYCTAFNIATTTNLVLTVPALPQVARNAFCVARRNFRTTGWAQTSLVKGPIASAKPQTKSRDTSWDQDRGRGKRAKNVTKGALANVGTVTPTIQWYPGHIAKAERALKECIKMVDVIIEVRDCRIPIATAHPDVPKWVGNRSRVLAMNRADLAPEPARSQWRKHLLEQGEQVRFINAKQGRGIKELKKLAVEAGSFVNDKRKKRGLLPRPVRCLVIGYPNVGKSALINRLVGKNAAKSANKPGVTRNYQWVRMSDTIELLDMPGIIPAKLVSQDTALRLAICDDIGQAAYDRQVTAGLMIEELKRVSNRFPGFFDMSILAKRFKVDPLSVIGEEFVHLAAEKLYKGDAERTAVRLLTEFRAGILGLVALEAPVMLAENDEDVITRRDV